MSGLVATVTMGLINVLQQMTAAPEKESEMSKAMTETHELLKQQLKKDNSGTEVRMDKNYVSIGKDGHSKVVTSNDKDLVWGDDKEKK